MSQTFRLKETREPCYLNVVRDPGLDSALETKFFSERPFWDQLMKLDCRLDITINYFKFPLNFQDLVYADCG